MRRLPGESRVDFIVRRDGREVAVAYCALMRRAYRSAVLKGQRRADGTKGPISRTHPFRRKWIEGYLEFRVAP